MNYLALLTGRDQGCLVADVGDVSSGESRAQARQFFYVYVFGFCQGSYMDLEDLDPLFF